MSTRKYIRVSISGNPVNHFGFTLNDEWNLNSEMFNEFVENFNARILPNRVKNVESCGLSKNVLIDDYALGKLLEAAHFSGRHYTKALAYIKHRGAFRIVFELMSKNRSKIKKQIELNTTPMILRVPV